MKTSSVRPAIAASLWSVTKPLLNAQAASALSAGLRRFHWDHSDGIFAKPGGFSPLTASEIIENVGAQAAKHEAHIMVTEPEDEIDAWAIFCDRIIVHAELGNWRQLADRITSRGCTPVLAISPETKVSLVPDDIAVLCMSVTPGQAGADFRFEVLKKISILAARNRRRPIGLDGGVTLDIAHEAKLAGANWLVVGNNLFNDAGINRWKSLF